MKAVANGKVVENKLPGGGLGATKNRREVDADGYEDAVNACWTDDQPGNISLPGA